MHSCTIIGITDSRKQWFSPDIMAVITGGRVFSGGRRHHEIMKPFLPDTAIWIDIVVPISSVFQEYTKYDDIIIFASGDPFFYGFANTVMRECPDVSMKVYPSFNSLQMLAHRMYMPYQDMRCISLTGRSWDKLDEALINDEPMIGCLTDKNKTPHNIHARMNVFGFGNYDMFVGSNLGNEETESVGVYDEKAIYGVPNCVILKRMKERNRRMGIQDEEFSLLDNRKKMITKMPVRLCSVSMLDLGCRHSFWDIGFCTGSVSIEAKLRYPHLHITSFELRSECAEIMEQNCRKFHAPGIHTVIGDFMQVDISDYEAPEAVFIGGHGGKLKEMLQKIKSVLLPNGVIVFNSVSESTRQMFIDGIDEIGMTIKKEYHITVDNNNPIAILKAQ